MIVYYIHLPEGEDDRIFNCSYYHTILEKDSELYHCIINLDIVTYRYIDQIDNMVFSLFFKEEDLTSLHKSLLSLVGNVMLCNNGITMLTKKDTIVYVPYDPNYTAPIGVDEYPDVPYA